MKRLLRFDMLIWPVLVLVIVAVLLFAERYGVLYTVSGSDIPYLSQEFIEQSKQAAHRRTECVVLVDGRQENQALYQEHLAFVLDSMSVGYDVVDVGREAFPDLTRYRTAIIACSDLEPFAENIFRLTDWVDGGGRCMLFASPEPTPVFRSIASRLGIREGGTAYTEAYGLRIRDRFMIGSEDFVYNWGEPYSTVLNVRLDSRAVVHMVSDDSNETPMLWEYDYGDGRFVCHNHGICERTSRGITAASYSLLEDHFAYPVINSSLFFLDDFPSPVPMGDATYIEQYFQRDIASFYANVWWPDMMRLADQYGLRFTGLVIEDYSEQTEGPFPRQTDTDRFRYFGGLLLEQGGEIGIHGYNHMSLCLNGFDYQGKVDYISWPTVLDMQLSLQEVMDFTRELFPDNTISTYVPPSNILSPEGRELLGQTPGIRTIASVYVSEDIEYEQEFCVSDDGIVELPRVISGTQIDQYMYWAAFNELNFHYVNSHFMHPDDPLDVDRGAAKGWNAMLDELERYIGWLYDVAPNLRNQTASEGSKAVQRYDVLTVDREYTDGVYTLSLQGFVDEAYCMVRLSGVPHGVTGGSLEQLGSDLYLLRATAPEVSISVEG